MKTTFLAYQDLSQNSQLSFGSSVQIQFRVIHEGLIGSCTDYPFALDRANDFRRESQLNQRGDDPVRSIRFRSIPLITLQSSWSGK